MMANFCPCRAFFGLKMVTFDKGLCKFFQNYTIIISAIDINERLILLKLINSENLVFKDKI